MSNQFSRIRDALKFTDYPTTGDVYFVHSGTGSTGSGYGSRPGAPAATIDQAVNLCTADQGDIVFVMPGHTETISGAAGVAMDTADVSIIGLGNGSNRPTLTFSAAASDINVSATDCKIKNIRCVSSVNDLTNFIDVDEGYCTIEDCWFETSSDKEAKVFIDIATTKDHVTIRGCTFLQPTDPAGSDGGAGTGAIYLVDSEHVTIEDCKFVGNFETSIIHNKTTGCKQLWVRNCFGQQDLSGAEIINLASGATGGMDGCLFISPNATAVTEGGIIGTLQAGFFIGVNCGFGNDGGGGQLAVAGAAAAS